MLTRVSRGNFKFNSMEKNENPNSWKAKINFFHSPPLKILWKTTITKKKRETYRIRGREGIERKSGQKKGQIFFWLLTPKRVKKNEELSNLGLKMHKIQIHQAHPSFFPPPFVPLSLGFEEVEDGNNACFLPLPKIFKWNWIFFIDSD